MTAAKWALFAMCVATAEGGGSDAAEGGEAAPPAASLDPSLALVLHGLGEWAHIDSTEEAPSSSPRGGSGRSKGKGKKPAAKKAAPKKGAAKGKKGGGAPAEGPVVVDVDEEGAEKYNLNVADTLAEEGEIEEVSAPVLHQVYHAIAAELPCLAVVQPYAAGDKAAYTHTARASLCRPAPGVTRNEAAGASDEEPVTLRSAAAPLVLLSDSSDGAAALAPGWTKEQLSHGLLMHPNTYTSVTQMLEAAGTCIIAGVPLHLRHSEQAAHVLGTPMWASPSPASAQTQNAFLVDLALALNAVTVQLCAPSTAAAASELARLTELEASVPGCVWAGETIHSQQAAAGAMADSAQHETEEGESKK